jgi:hypothetical protein
MDRLAAQLSAINSFLTIKDLVIPHRGTSSQEDVIATLRLLRPYTAVGVAKKRFGSAGDGGYVMLDDLTSIGTALSFGIDVNDDWDLELARLGIKIQQYDNSVERAPSSHPNLTFMRKTVGTHVSYNMVTLPSLLDAIEGEVLLKIDIEGHEWDVFDDADVEHIHRCRQICCEFHSLAELSNEHQLTKFRRVLTKLAETHRVVHVHGNNCGAIKNVQNVPVPDVLEVTFASRDSYCFVESWDIFPGPLDAPNRDDVPDIHLGYFAF